MLQNARVTAFTVSELLRENQQGGKITSPPSPAHTLTHIHTHSQIKVNDVESKIKLF